MGWGGPFSTGTWPPSPTLPLTPASAAPQPGSDPLSLSSGTNFLPNSAPNPAGVSPAAGPSLHHPSLGLRPSLILSLHTHSVFLSLQQVSQAAVTPGPAWQLRGGAAALGLWLWRAVAALAAERGLSSWGAQVSCLVACGIFPHQGSPSPPCVGRWVLNHNHRGSPQPGKFCLCSVPPVLLFSHLVLQSDSLSSLNFK